MVEKYVKKPLVIEAVQWMGDNFVEVDEFVTVPHITRPAEGHVILPTLEGNMLATRCDYIIKGVKGEFYPCKPEIFCESYDKCSPLH